MTDNLLPCPFCGVDVEITSKPAVGTWITCETCGYEYPSVDGQIDKHYRKADVIERWNTRAERTCHLFRRASYGTLYGVELALYECSECGEPIEPKDGWNYCPNCGARVVEVVS